MTCAGVSSLVITGQRLFRGLEDGPGGQIRRCGQVEPDLALLRGAGLARRQLPGRPRTSAARPAGSSITSTAWNAPGRLAGVRYFGEHDWYREGAEELVKTQDQAQRRAGPAAAGPVVATSFALLFLAKGRAPVLVNKLRHGRGQRLGERPRRRPEPDRRWSRATGSTCSPGRSSTPSRPRVEDLLQAPIAFINGHESPEVLRRGRRPAPRVRRPGRLPPGRRLLRPGRVRPRASAP